MAKPNLMAKAKRILQLKKEGRIAEALKRAESLAAEHPGEVMPHCLLGNLHFVAVVRAREAAARSEEEPGDASSRSEEEPGNASSPSETHLRSARDALSEAKILAPDSVDVATALAVILIESEMFLEAETEYRRAIEMEVDITTPARPAVNIPLFSTTPKQRREACQRLANRLVSHEVRRILDIRKTDGVGVALKMQTEGTAPTLDTGKANRVLETEVGAAVKTKNEGTARTLHIGKTDGALKTEAGATLKKQTDGSVRTLDISKTDSGAVVNTDGGSVLKTKTDSGSQDTEVKRNLDSGLAPKAAGRVDLTDGGAQKPDVLAMRILKEARSLANRFPGSARAQLCHLLAQLQHMRSLPRELDLSKGMERLLRTAGSAAQAFQNSVIIALFHAKLLLLSGRLDAAEAECHRALDMEDVSDPEEECIPPGSVGGVNYEARLSAVAGDIDCLLKQILGNAEQFWDNSLTAESKKRFLSLKIDVLQYEYTKLDQSGLFSMRSALSFFKENSCWRFWMCPLCNSTKKHIMPGLLMEHMYKKHPRSVLPSLQPVVNSVPVAESDGLFDVVSFTQDQDTHDIIQFEERSGVFRWLFSDTIRGEKTRPLCDIMQENCPEGRKILEIMKKKMASLPGNSSTDESPRLDEIRELWLQFLELTVFDYGKVMLTLARRLLWSEFKKHIARVQETACQRISADDVDDVFSTWSNADEEPMKEEISYPIGEIKNASVGQEAGDNLSLISKDINLMDIILKTLWSLTRFTDEVLKTEPLCSKHNHAGPCIGDIVHRIFSLWKTNGYQREDFSSLVKAVHRILDDYCFEKDQIKFISDITFTILNGLHLPDVCLHFGFVGDVLEGEVRAFKCKYHDPIGIKFLMHTSCGCQTCSSEHHDVDPNMVEQLCNQCTSAALKEPHSIIAVHWSDVGDDQKTLSETLNGWVQPEMTYHYKRGVASYNLAAMICYLHGFPVGLAQKGTSWTMYNETGELGRKDSWEGLLHMSRDCKPAVLFYEVIK